MGLILSGAKQEPKEGLDCVRDFLEQVALWSEPEKAAAEEDQEGAPDVVNVMTLHLSKGLEFAVVFIVGKWLQPFNGAGTATLCLKLTLSIRSPDCCHELKLQFCHKLGKLKLQMHSVLRLAAI